MDKSLRFRIFLGGQYYFFGFIHSAGGISFVVPPAVSSQSLSLEDVERHSEQFSGHKDNTGKDIWENDVLQCVNDRSRRFIVVYDRERGQWGRELLLNEGVRLFPLFEKDLGSCWFTNLGARQLANLYK